MLRNELLKQLSKKMVAEPDNYMVSFRKNLLTYIEEKEIRLSDIAEASGLSIETLKTLVYGSAGDCKLSTAVALARALQISVDELVGSGTISQPMRESIYTVRNMPENFVHFFRWCIKYHEKCLNDIHPKKRAINIMYAECMHDGNLMMTNNFEIEDISDMPDSKRYKIFMGIRVPCEHYMPFFREGDIMYIARDRRPLQSENVVVVNDGFIRLVKWREEKDKNGEKKVAYYSLNKNAFLAYKEEVDDVIGYIVDIKRAEVTD